MMKNVKNGILQMQLQWNCFFLVRTGKRMRQLKQKEKKRAEKKLQILQKRHQTLNRNISHIEASFI